MQIDEVFNKIFPDKVYVANRINAYQNFSTYDVYQNRVCLPHCQLFDNEIVEYVHRVSRIIHYFCEHAHINI